MSREYREENESLENNGPEVDDKNEFSLRLGDIIEISAPKNEIINEHTFFIEYINDVRIVLINVASMDQIQLNRDETTGVFSDKSIREIRLVSRSEHDGYARQNNLSIGTWIEIHIGGDVSTILTGEITSLEEDQIEVRTFPELDIIYIDFEYKGIPEHIPIKSIIIRDKPSAYKRADFTEEKEGSESNDRTDPTMEYLETGEIRIHAEEDAEEEESVLDLLRNKVAKSKEIVFGEDLDTVVLMSEIPENQKRYAIDLQTTSLLDELLSTIPSIQRDGRTMQKIHALISRYRQLRRFFSVFDENGEVSQLKRNNPHIHKPLVESIKNMNAKIDWILPVVSIKKKLYINEDNEDLDGGTGDAIVELFDTVLNDEEQVKKNTYYNEKTVSDESKYYKLYQQLEDFMRPFDNPDENPRFLESKEVQSSLEAIVDNLEDFYSSVMKTTGKSEDIVRKRYVIQKYDLGLDKRIAHMRDDREIIENEVLTRPDKMYVKGLVILPAPVMNYSRVNLPTTSILEKANLHLFPLFLFRILKKNKDIAPFIIEDLEKELYPDDGDPIDFLSEIRHYVISDSLRTPDYDRFLQLVIPKTKTVLKIIRKYVVDKLSLVSVVQALEPFKVYSDDLTYTQYLEIRRFIIEQIAAKKERLDIKRKEYGFLPNHKFVIEPHVLSIIHFLLERPEFLERFLIGYKLPQREFIQARMTSAEVLNRILYIDNGVLLCSLIGSLMSSLMTPTSLSSLFDANENDGDDKVTTADCNKRVLTKRYISIGDLQKDNGGSDIFYDKEFDETPYHIMDNYKEQKKSMLPDKFERFIIEALIEKHDCPKDAAPKLARVLIAGKKLVDEGEYAILVIKPHLEKGSLNDLSLAERRKAEDEANIRAKTTYYYRKNGTWVHYKDIDEDAFVDTNLLFCNYKKECIQNTESTNEICESADQVAKRMREIAKKRIRGEFDQRFELSYEDMKSTIENKIGVHLRYIQRWMRIQSIQIEKYNNIAYQIGLEAAGYSDAIISPYMGLRDHILGQSDFVKKQNDIIRLYDRFCREPMEILVEDNGWKYCKESNTKLLPAFLYELAMTFVTGGDYQLKLEELCHTHGLMSDAGNAIVDKHSGLVVRAIDYAEEDGYDAAGFKLTTHAFIDKGDVETAIENLMMSVSTIPSICESERNQMICNLLDGIAKQIGHTLIDIRDHSVRVAAGLCDTFIDTEEKYIREAKKMEEKKGIKLPPYKKRMNQLTILITAASLFMAIQTESPSFNTKKTMPGCVKSFRGFPLDGEEDFSGIHYMACVLSKMEKKIEPWNAIDRMTVAMIEEQMKKIIISAMKIAEVDDRYLKKREYLLVNFEEPIPESHALEKWGQFLPPLIDTNVSVGLRSITADFKDDFISLMKKGLRTQHADFMVLKSKVSAFAVGIIEGIQSVVQKKELLLTAMSTGHPFLQNVCCNEIDRDHIPLSYFAKDKEEIIQYMRTIDALSIIIDHVIAISKPALLYDPRDSKLKYPQMSTDISEQNIYAAFIYYCELDKGIGVPVRFHAFFTDIPSGYNAVSKGTIDEKIEFLKRHDKRFDSAQLAELMRLVSKENRIYIRSSVKYNVSEMLKDLMLVFDEHDSPVIDKTLRENLSRVLMNYDKTKLMTIIDDADTDASDKISEGEKKKTAAVKLLKNGLVDIMEDTFKPTVLAFLRKYGKMSAREYTTMTSFFDTVVKKWATPDLYKVSRFIKNAVDEMTRIFPNIILTNTTNTSRLHGYWNLADMDESKVFRSIQAYYDPLGEFRQDRVLTRLLMTVQSKFVDLRLFFDNLPIQESIRLGSRDYFSLFDKDTIALLLEYVFLSVLHEYIIATDNIDLIRLDEVERRISSRKNAAADAENNNIETEYVDVAEEYQETYGDMQEIQIQSGNQEELKTRVAKLLIAFLTITRKNKTEIDISYMNIAAAMRKRKEKEKNRIVERMTAMSPDERAVEDMKKKYKMDEWNVGTQRGIFEYDKKTSAREVMEQMAEDTLDIQKHGMRKADFLSLHGSEGDGALLQTIDMETMRSDIDDAADEETVATGLRGLKANFMDGQFYSDDESDDGFGYQD